jgi:hypothetical protein
VQDLGYIPKWLDGPGPSSEDLVRLLNQRFAQEQPHNITKKAVQEEALASVRSGYSFHLLTEFEFETPHVQKWIDALFETWRQQNKNEKETPEFLWAIFYKGVADEVILNKQDALVSQNIFREACQYLEPLRDRVELEAHKLQRAQAEAHEKDLLVPARGSPQSSGAGAATWDTIEISFLSDERVQIRNGTDNKTYNYAELRFEDSRNGKPNQAWVTMRDLAEAKGIILIDARRDLPWPKVEKRVQEIRKTLRDHFGISSDPFLFKEGVGYEARFKICLSPSFHT